MMTMINDQMNYYRRSKFFDHNWWQARRAVQWDFRYLE